MDRPECPIPYISRTLVVDRGTQDEEAIKEEEIAQFTNQPLIVLGEPGIGKTELTKSIERLTGGHRISAGTFSRSENLEKLGGPSGSPLIIDGLDEVSASATGSALDDVLRKLDRMGRPNFVVSCRAADWRGSADRYKIEQDYGVAPVTLHLQPFSHEEALAFLHQFDRAIDGEKLLDEISRRGLSELAGNPLTLRLVAEVVRENGELPASKADLLERASRLLVTEENPAHAASPNAQASVDDLLLSAGGIFAHLLISGSLGVSAEQRDHLPEGFVHLAAFVGILKAPFVTDVIGTRLFVSEGEGRFIPVHRVVAEYLGGRWLSERLKQGLSERRLFQALHINEGVPGPLRGLHAWLGHFNASVADRCIRADPYGVLRYGEPDKLPIGRARLLLTSLAELANEDPYFRSEDWGVRAVSGLARAELKDEIIALVSSPDRHFHLSSLLLEALPGSTLAAEIAPELLELIANPTAAQAERYHAAEALIASGADVDWCAIVKSLRATGKLADKRLAIEIIEQCEGSGFDGTEIAEALTDYVGLNSDRKNEDHVAGVEWSLVHRLPAAKCPEILDGIAAHISRAERPRYWTINSDLTSTMHKLIIKSLREETRPAANRLWSWMRFMDSGRSYDTDARNGIRDYLQGYQDLRLDIQRIALHDATIDGGPWMAIVDELPRANEGLFVSVEDAAAHLRDIAEKPNLSVLDVTIWKALVQYQRRADGVPPEISAAASEGARKHAELAEPWDELQEPPPVPEWQKEQHRHQRERRRAQARKWAGHRASFEGVLEKIATGKALGALESLANGYLGRYADIDRDVPPIDRLIEWVGKKVADAATEGFIATLFRDDLPTANTIAAIRNEGKRYNVEAIMLCGVAEMLRQGRSLEELAPEVLEAILAVWWDMPEFNSSELGKEIERQLDARVLASDEAAERFILATIEPGIRAGREHVPGLYRFLRDDAFRRLVKSLTIDWLVRYPAAPFAIQNQLLEGAMRGGASEELKALVAERLKAVESMDSPTRLMWLGAAFVLNIDGCTELVASWAGRDKQLLWSVRDFARHGWRADGPHWPLTLSQLEFIVRTFGVAWAHAGRPTGMTQGDGNPWDASNFIMSCIDGISSDPTDKASGILDRLTEEATLASYRDIIKHARAQQRRLRRDKEFLSPSFEAVKSSLADGVPGTIDDLKSVILDQLETLQIYVRVSDTDAWETFWEAGQPRGENACRHRLLDLIRPHLKPKEIDLLPETLMPEKKRTDIVGLHKGKGLPIEVKGQWHRDVWDASSTQLDDKYTRDWRADGRGIYLALWFGNVTGKNPPPHPEGLPAPTIAAEFQSMLQDRLLESQRSRIDVVVLDVSKGESKKSKCNK